MASWVLLSACGAPQTRSEASRGPTVVERLSAVLSAEFGLRGVEPQGLSLLSVGHIVEARDGRRLRSRSAIVDLCGAAVDPQDLVRRGPIAAFSFDEAEQFDFDAQVGLHASHVSDWLPDVKMQVTDGDSVKMTLNLQNAELLVLNEGRFARYLEQAVETCHALVSKAPFQYVRELILAEVEFTFRRTGATTAGVALGWTGPSRSGEASQTRDDEDDEADEGENADEDVSTRSAGSAGSSMLGLSADGKWRIEKGGKIVSNQKLVVGVALAEFDGR